MVSVRLRQSRLYDVPIGLMSDKNAAKFAGLVQEWQTKRSRTFWKFDTKMDLAELRKGLTPGELEILECRYEGLSFEEIATELHLTPEEIKTALKRVWRRARRMGIPDLDPTGFERELIGIRENKQPSRYRAKPQGASLKRVIEDIENRSHERYQNR